MLGMCRFQWDVSIKEASLKGLCQKHRLEGGLSQLTIIYSFYPERHKKLLEKVEFSTEECSHPVSCCCTLLAGVYFGCFWPRAAGEINPCMSWKRCLHPEQCSPDLSEPPLCLGCFIPCLVQVHAHAALRPFPQHTQEVFPAFFSAQAAMCSFPLGQHPALIVHLIVPSLLHPVHKYLHLTLVPTSLFPFRSP